MSKEEKEKAYLEQAKKLYLLRQILNQTNSIEEAQETYDKIKLKKDNFK